MEVSHKQQQQQQQQQLGVIKGPFFMRFTSF